MKDYKFNIKVAIDLALRDVEDSEEYAIKDATPSQVYDVLTDLGWEYGERDANKVEDWVYDTFYHNDYPYEFLTMCWNGWTGSVILYAVPNIDEEDR